MCNLAVVSLAVGKDGYYLAIADIDARRVLVVVVPTVVESGRG